MGKSLEELWQEYCNNSYAQMFTVAAMDEVSDIEEIEQQFGQLDG